GTQLVWSTLLGGGRDDMATAVALDPDGNVVVAGSTLSQNFPTTSGAYSRAWHGGGRQPSFPAGDVLLNSGDVFVTKINSSGSAIIASTLLGGRADDFAQAMTVDASGNIYVAGATLSPDFPVTSGAFQTTYSGSDGRNVFFNFGDAFITKFNPSLTT